MSDKKEKTPEEKAFDAVSKAYWNSISTDMDSNYLAHETMVKSARESIKNGIDPNKNKDLPEATVNAIHKAQVDHYGLSSVPNATYYVDTGHGWNEQMITENLNKSGFSGAAIDGMNQSKQRQQARQNFQGYKLKAELPKDEGELKAAANYSGLGKVLDWNQVDRVGGPKAIGGLIAENAYNNKLGIGDEENTALGLNQSGLAALVNQSTFDKYLKKKD